MSPSEPILPVAAGPATLERNARALGAVAPALVERLTRPASTDHLQLDPQGAAALAWRGTWQRLDLSGDARAGAPLDLGARTGERDPETLLLFGLGLGETLARALAGEARRVVAWERDPVLLRLVLERYDLADAIAGGRLELALGTDLLPWTRERVPGAVRAHPVLGSLWERERRLVERGLVGRPIAVAEGRLFVDQVGACLERLGFAPWTLDLEGLAVEELTHQLDALEPAALVAINHLHGAAEFCAARGLPLVTWEIDPSTDRLPTLGRACPDAHVFTYRRAHVETFRAAGFEHVAYRPLATDTHARRPAELAGEDAERYRAPVVFVGASMVERGSATRDQFLALYRAWARDTGAADRDGAAALEQVLADQRADLSRYRVPDLLRPAFGPFLDALERLAAAGQASQRPDVLAAEAAAAEKRLSWIAALAEFGVEVWGDDGWKALERHGVRHRGGAGHRAELNRVYSGATINVDVGRIYQDDIVTMRVFDVLACGGFALVERNVALEECFALGEELEAYRDVAELRAKVAHYLAHPAAAGAIAQRGLAAVRERHDMTARLAEMLATAGVG